MERILLYCGILSLIIIILQKDDRQPLMICRTILWLKGFIMRKILLIAIAFIFIQFGFAQNVQWANEVLDFSSEYGDDDFSANQALGVPNALGSPNLYRMAWAPKKEESATGEFIRVSFSKPMPIQQVAIAESMGPGAIAKIFAFDTKGKKHSIYENSKPGPISEPQRLFRHKFTKTTYAVKEIRVELKTKAVKGPNQIDAIAISDSKTSIKLRVEELEYSETLFAPERLGPNINSEFAERLPIISPDGQTLYFARKYHPQNIGEDNADDIWVSKRNRDGSWNRSVNIGTPLNNKTHNFVIATNPNGNVLYLANDYNSKAKDGVSMSKKKGRTWSKPKTLNIENHYNDDIFVGYHVNAAGNVLLMAVKRKDSVGERDLYVSFLSKFGKWTEPKNLGRTINTVGEESSVFIAADNKTIYFASSGHQGHGGLDMFMSRRLDESWTKWSKPLNLGKEINSRSNDYNYTIPASGEYAYFSRDNQNGMSNLFRIKLPKEVQPEPVVLLTGHLIDAETKRPIKAKVKYQSLRQKETDVELDSEDDGLFQMVVPYGDDIGISAEVDGYFAVAENMELSDKWLEDEDFDNSELNGNSEELDKLQRNLNELNQDLDRLKKKKSNPKKKKAAPTSSYGSAPKFKTEDKELAALKQKFQKHYNTTKTNTKQGPASKKTDAQKEKTKDDLQAMKDKFNKHHSKDQKQAKEKPKQQSVPVNSSENDADDDFEKLKESVRQDLAPTLKLELQKKLIDELRPEIEKDLNEEIRNTLEDELKSEVEAQLKRELEEEVRQTLKEEERNNVKKELEGEMLDEIEEELKEKLEEEVRTQLIKELKAPLREELRTELELRLKEEIEAKLKQELQEEQKKQSQSGDTKPKYNRQPAPEKEEPVYKELSKEILLVPIKVGQIIPMNNIFFDANKSSLKESSFTELERVLNFLKNNPNLVVEVGGHTNGWCGHEFASELSKDRSKEVADYFTSNGIPENKIAFKGYGKTTPIADNNTLAGRKKNQRVELKILEILD